MSSATRPARVPTYATPPAIAADDSTASPASYVHSGFSRSGSAPPVATPVRSGPPRNCGHDEGPPGAARTLTALTTRISETGGRRARSAWRPVGGLGGSEALG